MAPGARCKEHEDKLHAISIESNVCACLMVLKRCNKQDNLLEYFREAIKEEQKSVEKNLSMHSFEGYKHAYSETLSLLPLNNQIAETQLLSRG